MSSDMTESTYILTKCVKSIYKSYLYMVHSIRYLSNPLYLTIASRRGILHNSNS